jgi:hypothetical protein
VARDDTAGTINITTGTGPSAGVLAVVTFANAWTTTTLTISCANAPAASTVYSFDYQAIGGA